MPELPVTALVNLGCPKNQVDAEQLLQLLTEAGFPLTTDQAAAEVIIVNTCAFIQPAVEESLEAILEAAGHKETGACRCLVVMGCLPPRYRQRLAVEIPEIDLLVATSAFTRLPAILKQWHRGGPVEKFHLEPPAYRETGLLPQLTCQSFSAYLKIAEGCDNRCAYCLIPSLRGKQVSFPPALLAEKAAAMAAAGVRELNLVAQDLTAYGRDLPGQPTLAQLLRRLLAIEELAWLRLLYAYPGKISDELVELLAGEEKLCPYLDLPIQHISATVLRRMQRHDPPAKIRAVIERLRSLPRTVHLRSTVIVGFPGETEADFRQLLDFVAEGHFTYLGCFAYWPEPGTPAASLADQVPEQVKFERYQQIIDCQRQVTRRHLQVYRQREIPLLVEGKSPETELLLQARAPFQAPEIDGVTYVTEGFAQPGTILTGRIDEIHDYDLFASLEPAARP
ncbi:MAG: 30S ribosomal protein S12 methylthiotransferase RimO [Deltaproteobacteria bacterium]|nr:30S ribosomal protein S12 methylthiotransferase RimO [Deltaproteobacteria bacterium]